MFKKQTRTSGPTLQAIDKKHISPSAGMACGLLEQIYAPSPPVSKVPRKDLSS